jgi:MEDS: MEthanogen/methylotroph, DcmR Sensory domain
MKWFDEEVRDGENSIIIYPNLQTFRQIYTKYVKDQLAKEDENNSKRNEPSLPRIMLIATFYETTDSVKHHLSAAGLQNIQSLIDNGSLVIVDAFSSYYPKVDGMKKLVASLSDRARKEGRDGVTAIVDMGFFFLFGGDGRATELINYEASLAPTTEGGNVKGFSCYHGGNYNTLKDDQKKELAQRQKKVFEVTESTTTS